jgi:4'-phosphopantetheinyl transferase
MAVRESTATQMLSLDRVYIWRVSLDRSAANSAAQLEYWRAMLSAEELCKSRKFHSEKLCHDYIASHAALRLVLGYCLGVSPASVHYANEPVSGNEGGSASAATTKPALLHAGDRDNQPASLHFNLSHTSGAALIGVALGRELGVDIEWHRPLGDLHDMAQNVMSNLELEQWLTMPPVEQTIGFYNVWTRKEAYLKAIGLGLYRSLQEVTVPVSASPIESQSDEPSLVHDDRGAGNWTIRDIPVNEGYSASVCREGSGTFDLAIEDLNMNLLSSEPIQAKAHVMTQVGSR